MLSYMRKNAGSWVIRLLLFGIAIVFAFWGVGTYSNQNANTVLVIDDVKVPYTEYRDIYNALVDSYRQAYDKLDASALALLDVKGQAIETLLQRYLLLDGARRLKIITTAEEVAGEISRTPAFIEGGLFSEQRYQAFLELNRFTKESFENSVRRDLTIRKAVELIRLPAVVTPQEVDEYLTLLTREITVRSLELNPNDFLRGLPEATDEEVDDYFEKNKELYRVPERYVLAVVKIDPEEMIPRTSVSEDEIEEWYEDHKAQFVEPAAFDLRHILFAFRGSATAESITAARQEAEQVASDLQNGRISFSAAASRYSDDKATSGKGGSLGFITEDQLEPAIATAAEALEDDKVSDPIPTARGFEIISVDNRREERSIPIEEVKGSITSSLRQEKAFDMAYDLADDIMEDLEDRSKTLEAVAAERQVAVRRTPPFSRQDQQAALEEFPRQVLIAAMDTEQGESGDIYEEQGKLFVFQNLERTESSTPPLTDVVGEVRAGILVQKALDRAYSRGEEIAASISEGSTSLEAEARKLNRQVSTSPPFSVMETSLPGIDEAETFIRKAFTIREAGKAAVARGLQGHHLLVLDRVITPQSDVMESQRKQVEEALLAQRQQDLVTAFVEKLKTELGDRIVVNKDLL